MKLKKVLLVSVFVLFALSMGVFAADVRGGTVQTASAVNLRNGPSTDDSVLNKLYSDDRVAVLESTDTNWYKVAYKGVIGYLHGDYLDVQDDPMNIECGGAKITASALNLRSGPSTSDDIITRLNKDSIAKIIGINNGWFKVSYNGYTGYVHPEYVTVVEYQSTSTAYNTSSGTSGTAGSAASSDNVDLRQQILDYAAKYLGVKYVYGGSSPDGFDCSGYTQYIFKNFGITLSRTSSDQYSSSVSKISKSELQPGDLVFFSSGTKGKVGHVGIYVGNDQFIHSTSPGGVVQYDSMSSSYYSKHYIGSGTVLS